MTPSFRRVVSATRKLSIIGLCALLLCLWLGCGFNAPPANPFQTLAEMSAIGSGQQQQAGGGGGGQVTPPAVFRSSMNVVFNNVHPQADLDTSFLAWVDAGSVRTAEQQEELINGGYIQITQELAIGTAQILGVGTYVYYGTGALHATPIRLGPSQAATESGGAVISSQTIRLVTPDAMLVFSAPPVSCDSVAFVYTIQGEPLPSVPAGGLLAPHQGATLGGGFKTLAQVSAYECNPFRPGLFLRRTGGAAQPNEYNEGQNVTFDFFGAPDAEGNCANVTIGNETT